MGRYVVVYQAVSFVEDIDYDPYTHSICDDYSSVIVKTIYYDVYEREYFTVKLVVDETKLNIIHEEEVVFTKPIDYRHYKRIINILLDRAKKLLTPWFEKVIHG